MDTYDVEHTLLHDGEEYEPGDQVELSDSDAESLLARNPAPISEPTGPEPEELTAAEERVEELEAELEEARKPHPLMPRTVDEVEYMADGIDDPTRLDDALREERAGKNRNGAIEAIEDRLEALQSGDGDEG